MLNTDLAIPYFRDYGIKRAALFGSQARGDAAEYSDIDLVVSFGREYDLLDIIALKQDLEDVFHLSVDVITYSALQQDSFSQNVLREEKIIYEQQ